MRFIGSKNLLLENINNVIEENIKSAESKDWIMRISEYYKIETLINIMKYNKLNMKE